MLRNIGSKFFKERKFYTIKWGRFEPCKDKNQETIKTILNASDHCGDNICGNPYLVKDIIENNICKDKDLKKLKITFIVLKSYIIKCQQKRNIGVKTKKRKSRLNSKKIEFCHFQTRIIIYFVDKF